MQAILYVLKQLNWSERKVSHKHTKSAPLSLSSCCTSQCLFKQPIMLPLQEAATDLPAALFLFGFVNRVFQGPRHQIWNRNCSLISLEAGWRGVGRAGANSLPPSLHYAACFPVSASQVFLLLLFFHPSILLQVHHNINLQKYMNMTCCMHTHGLYMVRRGELKNIRIS